MENQRTEFVFQWNNFVLIQIKWGRQHTETEGHRDWDSGGYCTTRRHDRQPRVCIQCHLSVSFTSILEIRFAG